MIIFCEFSGERTAPQLRRTDNRAGHSPIQIYIYIEHVEGLYAQLEWRLIWYVIVALAHKCKVARCGLDENRG